MFAANEAAAMHRRGRTGEHSIGGRHDAIQREAAPLRLDISNDMEFEFVKIVEADTGGPQPQSHIDNRRAADRPGTSRRRDEARRSCIAENRAEPRLPHWARPVWGRLPCAPPGISHQGTHHSTPTSSLPTSPPTLPTRRALGNLPTRKPSIIIISNVVLGWLAQLSPASPPLGTSSRSLALRLNGPILPWPLPLMTLRQPAHRSPRNPLRDRTAPTRRPLPVLSR